MQSATRPEAATETAVDSVMHALMSVGRLMRQRVEGDVLDPGTIWLLKSLAAAGPIRITELATATNLDTSTVSRHITQLERTGLVLRTPDPADGRAQLIALTDHGRQQLDAGYQRRRALLATSLTGWDQRDIDTFQRLLAQFVAAIDTTPTTSKDPS